MQLREVLLQLFRYRLLLAPELLRDALVLDGVSVLGIIVEVQLTGRSHAICLARVRCNTASAPEVSTCVLVTVDEAVARWASKHFDMGAGGSIRRLRSRPGPVEVVF